MTHTKQILRTMLALAILLLCIGCDNDGTSQQSDSQKAINAAEKQSQKEREHRLVAEERTHREQERTITAEGKVQSAEAIKWVFLATGLVFGTVAGTAIACKVKKDHRQQRQPLPDTENNSPKGY